MSVSHNHSTMLPDAMDARSRLSLAHFILCSSRLYGGAGKLPVVLGSLKWYFTQLITVSGSLCVVSKEGNGDAPERVWRYAWLGVRATLFTIPDALGSSQLLQTGLRFYVVTVH